MPREPRIDDEVFIRVFQRFQPAVDLVVDLGMVFHIAVEFVRGHAALQRDLSLNGARRIKFQAALFSDDAADGAFSAPKIARE